jgi:CRISPR-associated endonuclease/helicase Cas3
LDISSDLLLSELSPVDSLIQRAGRCARHRKEKAPQTGKLVVFEPQMAAPYSEDLINETRRVVDEVEGRKLDWKLELELVNRVLEGPFGVATDPMVAASNLRLLSEATFEGNRSKAEQAVREQATCFVTIRAGRPLSAFSVQP